MTNLPAFVRQSVFCAALAAPLILHSTASAQSAEAPSCPIVSYFSDWFERVDKTRAEQPHWAPTIATTSPALQEVMRYDISWQSLANGHTLTSYGSGKGLEFIPSEHIQFIIGVPPWQTQDFTPHKDGWGDESFLMKYRLLSANEENGNYVVTGMLGLSVPNGSVNYTSHHFVFTPTLALGKGWGDFDLQANFGVGVPENEAGRRTIGDPATVNLAAQYQLLKTIWPAVELNYTWWPNGSHEGLNQALITPEVVLGKFPIYGRLAAMVGAGYQIAVTDHPLYHRNFQLTLRLQF